MSKENVEGVRRGLEAYNRLDPDAFMEGDRGRRVVPRYGRCDGSRCLSRTVQRLSAKTTATSAPRSCVRNNKMFSCGPREDIILIC